LAAFHTFIVSIFREEKVVLSDNAPYVVSPHQRCPQMTANVVATSHTRGH